MRQVLNHLDKIYFGSGALLLFKYPMQRRFVDKFKAEVKAEDESLDDEELLVLANARLIDSGITDDIEKEDEIICADYTDEEI